VGSTGAEGGVDTSIVIGGGMPATAPPVPLGGAGQASARGDAALPAGAGRRAPDMSENPLLPLRRLGVGAALDLGFELLRFRFGRLVALAACLFLPVQLVDLALRVWATTPATGEEAVSTGPALLFVGGSSDWVIVTLTLQALALSVLGLCVGRLVAGLLRGEDPDFRTLAAYGARRSWVALVIVPLAALTRVVLSCIPVVGFVAGDALVFVASIAAGVERLGPIAALGRNFRLTRAQFGPAAVLAVGSICITAIMRLSLYAGPAVLVSGFDPPEAVLVVVEQLSSLIQLVVQPLTACIAAAAYLLLCARVEGLDLTRRLAERQAERHALR
jgi:hypothetical protein